MRLIFGTTNKRKKEDLQSIIDELRLDIEVLDMEDIGWNRGEIEETGLTIEENSLIKAKEIYSFCLEHNYLYPIITDDTGLFVDTLNGEPGIYTVRYADDELAKDNSLPDYQCVIKLLRNLEGKENRDASFKCCVTIMMPNADYYQEVGETKGYIRKKTPSEFKKTYHYCVFSLKEPNKLFNTLTKEELSNTFRFNALRNTLIKYIDIYNNEETEIIKIFIDRIKNNKSIECVYITPCNNNQIKINILARREVEDFRKIQLYVDSLSRIINSNKNLIKNKYYVEIDDATSFLKSINVCVKTDGSRLLNSSIIYDKNGFFKKIQNELKEEKNIKYKKLMINK